MLHRLMMMGGGAHDPGGGLLPGQYRTDFSEYERDAAPDDWSLYYHATSVFFGVTDEGLVAPNGNDLLFRQNSFSISARMYGVWDAVPADADAEILMLAEYLSGDTGIRFQAIHRAAITSTASHDMLCSGWDNGGVNVTTRRLTNTSSSDAVSAAHGGDFITWNDLMWLRARIEGTAWRVRAWNADRNAGDLGLSDEPGTWQIDRTYSGLNAAGKVGIMHRVFGSDSNDNWMRVHYFGVGIEGVAAPGPVQ